MVEQLPLDFFLKRTESGELVLYLDEQPTSVDDIQVAPKGHGAAGQ